MRVEEDDNDIIAQLEGQASNQQEHLGTKRQRREAVEKGQIDQDLEEVQKRKRFDTAFSRIKMRNNGKTAQAKEDILDLDDIEDEPEAFVVQNKLEQ